MPLSDFRRASSSALANCPAAARLLHLGDGCQLFQRMTEGATIELPFPNRKQFSFLDFDLKLERSGLFYHSYYCSQVPELNESSLSAAEHYLLYGAWEDKDPNPLFSSIFYLEKNRDVYLSGKNPLLHYVERGASEGRDPHLQFSTLGYLEAYPEVRKLGINPLFHYLRYGILEGRSPSLPRRIHPERLEGFTYAMRSHWNMSPKTILSVGPQV
jgi:hypothetical protein